MITFLNRGQNFGWSEHKFVNSLEDFYKAPSPKVILIDTADDWYTIDRAGADLTLYWVSEALANERATGRPIVKLHPNDRVYSSSNGPNNQYDLLYWFSYMQDTYKQKYRLLIPKNEIVSNKICCTLGQGRLSRVYTYYKLLENNLDNRNISFATECFIDWLGPDQFNELPGQHKIIDFIKLKNVGNLQFRPLELDWNLNKNCVDWWGKRKVGPQISSIIPTKSYLDSSLILVHETIIHNPEFFVTEKTIKGILSGRPFIIIGCHKFLENLRNLGFLTWSSILDESYDEIENIKDRIDLAIESANEFIKENVLNSPKKLEIIKKISEHNRKIFFETNWENKIHNAQKQILLELGLPIS